MKLNRLVFFFRYYPIKSLKQYFSQFIGIFGAVVGYFLWLNIHLGWENLLLLFIPASMAFISACSGMKEMMWLAILLSLPLPQFIDIYPSFLPAIFYFISAFLSHERSLTKKDKKALERIIIEDVKRIEREIEEKKAIDPERINFERMYDVDLQIAQTIRSNYEHFVELKGSAFANTYRLGVFYVITRTNGVWDLKQVIGDNTLYSFKGTQKTGEYIGNHHFGYVGRAVGLSSTVLRLAAGMYQVYSGTSSPRYLFSYFDNPEDSQAILDGCIDYDLETEEDRPDK